MAEVRSSDGERERACRNMPVEFLGQRQQSRRVQPMRFGWRRARSDGADTNGAGFIRRAGIDKER